MYDNSTLKRFWNKVKVGSPDECWEWQGSKKGAGYGSFYVNKEEKAQRSHRVCWSFFNGPIPNDLHVLHNCHNPLCVNPAHLYLGTHQDNMRDRTSLGRWEKTRPRGTKHANSKLSELDVLEIRRLYATGKIEQIFLGKMFRVSHTQVSYIVNRRQWRHI